MHQISRLIAMTFTMFLLGGCQNDSEVAALKNDLATLKSEMAKQGLAVSSMEEDIKILEEWRVNFSKLVYEIYVSQESNSTASLKPGASGYQAVEFDLGMMVVSLEDITAYANGSKVTLQFGNLTSANVNGVSATFSYGATNGDGLLDTTTSKTKTEKFIEPFRAGAWAKVTVVLDGVKPESLGIINIGNLSHSGMVLSR